MIHIGKKHFAREYLERKFIRYNSKCVTDISFCFIFQKQNNKEKIWK